MNHICTYLIICFMKKFHPSTKSFWWTFNYRARKVSVFYNKLGHVEEDAEQEEVKDNDKDDDHKDYSDLPVDEDEDYAFPLDAIKEEVDQSIYENPAQQPRRIDNGREMIDNTMDSKNEVVPSQTSDPVDKPEQDDDYHDSFIETANNNNGDKRKLSLGVIFRKLSTGRDRNGIFYDLIGEGIQKPS